MLLFSGCSQCLARADPLPLWKSVGQDSMITKQVRVKNFVPNKKGDIGMDVYYLCQPNTYVIAGHLTEG